MGPTTFIIIIAAGVIIIAAFCVIMSWLFEHSPEGKLFQTWKKLAKKNCPVCRGRGRTSHIRDLQIACKCVTQNHSSDEYIADTEGDVVFIPGTHRIIKISNIDFTKL